jgi:hypothetical protein
VVFTVAVCWLFSAALFGGKALSAADLVYFEPPFSAHRPPGLVTPSNPGLTDPVFIYQPHWRLIHADLDRGQLPLWDPTAGAGRPLLASVQSAPLFPTNWPGIGLTAPDGYALAAALKLLLAALGAYVLARTLGRSRAASTVAGLAFGVGSAMVVFAEHPHGTALAMLPWIFAATDRICRRGDLLGVLGLAAAGALGVFAGHPETLLVGAVGAAAWALYRSLEQGQPRRLLLVAAGAAGAAALGAVVLIPFAELLAHAYAPSRNQLPPDAPKDLLYGLAFPDILGRPDKVDFGSTSGRTSGTYAGRAIYAGALPLLLAVAALVPRRGRDELFLAGLGAGGFALAVGVPGLREVVEHAPVLDLVLPHYFIWLTVIAVAVLAAFGFDRLGELDRRGRRWALGAMLVALVVPAAYVLRHTGLLSQLGAALDQQPVLGDAVASRDVATMAAVMRWLLFGGLAVAVAALIGWRRTGWVLAAAVALLAIDLVSLGRGYHPAVDPKLAVPPPSPLLAQVRSFDGPARVAGVGEALRPNLASDYGLRDARMDDLPMIERYALLWRALGGTVERGTGQALWAPVGARPDRPLDAFAVRSTLTQGPVALNPDPLPRAWVAFGWRAAPTMRAAIAATAASGRTELLRAPVVEGLPTRLGAPAPSPARIARDDPGAVDLSVRAPRPGLLVLDDLDYPGWSASVDGRDAPIHSANGAFRAIAVPAGAHTVRFSYEPASVLVGAIISAIAWLALIIAGVVLLVRGRTAGRT